MAEENQIRVGVGAVVFKDDCILLIKRRYAPYAGQWAIPGGKVRFGEPLQQALVREILEETGISILVQEPVYSFDVIQKAQDGQIQEHYVVVDFEATYVSGEVAAADDAAVADWVSRAKFREIDVNHITASLLHDKFAFP